MLNPKPATTAMAKADFSQRERGDIQVAVLTTNKPNKREHTLTRQKVKAFLCARRECASGAGPGWSKVETLGCHPGSLFSGQACELACEGFEGGRLALHEGFACRLKANGASRQGPLRLLLFDGSIAWQRNP